MANPGFQQFRNKLTGEGIFTDGTARERLAATLNDRLTDEPSRDQQRQDADAKVRAGVDANWPQDKMVAAANRVIAAMKSYAASVAKKQADLRPEKFSAWITSADEAFAETLIKETIAFRGIVESATGRSPRAARPFPVGSSEIAALALRLSQLDGATPDEAKALIEDGIIREDIPFLTQAASNVRSWTQYRHSWKDQAATRVAQNLLDQISGTIETPENVAADYAEEKAQASVRAWNNLVVQAQKTDAAAIDVYRQTGALSPLFEPGRTSF